MEEVLSPYFGGMVAFVKDTEMHLEKGSRERIAVNESELILKNLAITACNPFHRENSTACARLQH